MGSAFVFSYSSSAHAAAPGGDERVVKWLLALVMALTATAQTTMPVAVSAVKEEGSGRPASNKSGPAGQKSSVPAAQAQQAARRLQEEAIRRQVGQSGSGGFFALDWDPLPPEPASEAGSCEPLTAEESQALLDKTAKASGLDGALLRAVIEQESGWRPCAQSPKGATGLMQLMPEVAGRFQVDASDPEQNLKAGATYLKELLTRYSGDVSLALAAYNAGPARVDATATDPKARKVPDIAETKAYVASILAKIKATGSATSSGTANPP